METLMAMETLMETGMETDQVMVMAVVITAVVTMADTEAIMVDTEVTMVAIGALQCGQVW